MGKRNLTHLVTLANRDMVPSCSYLTGLLNKMINACLDWCHQSAVVAVFILSVYDLNLGVLYTGTILAQ